MKLDEARLSLVAVVVGGVVGLGGIVGGIVSAKLSADAAHSDAVEILQAQQGQSEIVELRRVLDLGASRVTLGLGKASVVGRLWENPAAYGFDTYRKRSDDLNEVIEDAIASQESLRVRLGPDATASRHYRVALDLLYRTAALYVAEGSTPEGRQSRDRMLKEAYDEYHLYLREANRLAGSRLQTASG